MNQILLVILGSLLALMTSYVIEKYKDRSNQKNLNLNFKTILRLELKNLLSVIDKLSDHFSSKTYYPFVFIEQLDKGLQRLENIRKDSIYLNEDTKKEEILICLNDLSIFASDLRGVENYYFTKIENETDEASKIRIDYSTRERQMLALRTIDLKRRIQDVVNFTEQK